VITLNIPTASANNRGALSSTDWTAFNSKQSALTFSTGLTNTTGTVTVNTSQNISTLSNLTSNGIVTTSGGTGALSVVSALPVSNGGTGTTTAPTAGGIIYASSTSAYASTALGTAGQVLISQGTSAPVWASQISQFLSATDNATQSGETWSSKSGSGQNTVYTYSFPLSNTPLNTSFEIYRYNSSSTSTGSRLRAYDANNFTSGWRYDSANKTIYYSSTNNNDTYMLEIVYYK
jgi:hypothetical protein